MSKKDIISEEDWRASLAIDRPLLEPPDDNWISVYEIMSLTGYNKRWIQEVLNAGRASGAIRDPVRVKHADGSPLKYWYGPEVAAEVDRRRKVNNCRRQPKDASRVSKKVASRLKTGT